MRPFCMKHLFPQPDFCNVEGCLTDQANCLQFHEYRRGAASIFGSRLTKTVQICYDIEKGRLLYVPAFFMYKAADK